MLKFERLNFFKIVFIIFMINSYLDELNLLKERSAQAQDYLKRLFEEEEKYRLMAENTTDVLFVQDLNLNMVYVSPSVENISGYSVEEVLNMSMKDLMTPESYNKGISSFQRCLKSVMEGHDVVVPTMEYQYICKDGSPRWGELNVTFLRDPEGQPVGVQGIIRDITRRKETEESLQKARDEYLTITNLTGDIIVKADKEGKWTFLNDIACHFWGKNREELIGSFFVDYLHPDDYEKTVAAIEEGKKKKSLKGLINRQNTPQGWRTVEWNAAAIFDDKEGYVGFQATGRDITEQRKMEEKVVQLNEILRLLNKTLRHDLLNDLTVINNSVDMYEELWDKKFLDLISISVNKSISLIKKMAELESLVSCGQELKAYDVRKIIEEVITSYSVDVVVEGSGTVIADETINSIIDNLMRNAINHGKADHITVNIEPEDNFCKIRFGDNGVGIPDHLKDKIFVEGFSGNHGTGLGLYIAKKTIERCGGTITVEDNQPSGSLFIMELRKD